MYLPNKDVLLFRCPVCGEFEITGPAISRLKESWPTDRAKLSGWLYDRKDTGDVPNITADALDEICALPRPSLDERGRRFLREAIRNTEQLGERFNIYATSYMVATYSADRSEVKYLAQMLAERLQRRIEEVVGKGSTQTRRSWSRSTES